MRFVDVWIKFFSSFNNFIRVPIFSWRDEIISRNVTTIPDYINQMLFQNDKKINYSLHFVIPHTPLYSFDLKLVKNVS